MSELILLGAGASVEANIPHARDMTRRILKGFKERGDKYYEVMLFVLGGLFFQQGIRKQDPYGGINVEELFTAIQVLANRRDLEAYAFIGLWNSLIDTFEAFDLDDHSEQELVGLRPRDFVTSSNSNRIFSNTADLMMSYLIEICWVVRSSEQRLNYLRPIKNYFSNGLGRTIVTLNYDNAIEMVCDESLKLKTGIESWIDSGRISFDEHDVRLLKLHGSIDWAYEEYQNVSTKLPLVRLRKMDERPDVRVMPAVIFGQRNKLTAEGPFLELLRHFQDELYRVNLLTVIGYAFRDAHINEYITRWLNANTENRIRIVDKMFSFDDNRYLRDLKSVCGERAHFIEQPASQAIAELYGQ